MTLTVRLDPALETAFTHACQRRGVSKSQVVARAVREYVERDSDSQPTLGELGRDLFGADSAPLPKGGKNVSGRVKSLLDDKLRAKHSR